MGRVILGNGDGSKPKTVVEELVSEQVSMKKEIVEVEKVVEVKVPVIKEVEKIVYKDPDYKELKDVVSSESSKLLRKVEMNTSKVEDLEQIVLERIEKIHSKCEEIHSRSEVLEKVINNQGAVLVYLRHKHKVDEEKRKRVLKRLLKQEQRHKKLKKGLAIAGIAGTVLQIALYFLLLK